MNNQADKKILSLFGLAARAGRMASGEFQTEAAVKDGTACLVVVAEDASDNTKKLFRDKCSFYKVPVMTLGTKEELGHAIGKEYRASLAILDQGFAEAVMKKINQESQVSQGNNGGK